MSRAGRVLAALAVVFAVMSGSVQAAPPSWLSGIYSGHAGAAAIVPTTLNIADAGANLTFSGGALTVTKNTNDAWSNVRSVASATTGKFYVEVCNNGTGPYVNAGISNATTGVNTNAGNSPDVVVWESDAATWYNNGGGYGNGTAGWFNPANCIDIAADVTNRKLWMRNQGAAQLWNNGSIGSQNPATNTGGLAFPTNLLTGAVYILIGVYSASAGNSATVNFGASAFTDTPPAGFGILH